MRQKGGMKYVPPRVLIELDNIKTIYDIKKDSRAFEKMAELTPVAMEVDKMMNKFVLADIFLKKKKKR